MVCFHRAKILKNCHPDAEFSFSEKWFTIFAIANKVSFQRKRNTSVTTQDQFVEAIMNIHKKLLRENKPGKFQLKYGGNIDQTHLRFVLDGNSTSDTDSAEETWVPDA